ncbi:DICER1 [Cordylochernes scorpioides]|uniref:DICER1 n=1 Tax=Cordylochernes scorpioides TaxID=51811 RepID=A0ABY6L037_9ARAC|nr:DICER1 [Cordylochernes scorpioides]
MVETRSGKMQDPAQERIMPEEFAKPQPGATIFIKEERMGNQDDEQTAVKDEIPEDNDFTPREYQVEIFKLALEQNTIALLGTGTGKTFISVMLIRHFSSQLTKPFLEGGKRTIFLVPTVPLAIQQCHSIRNQNQPQSGVLLRQQGSGQLVRRQVCQIILTHGFLALSQVNLMVFDECHKAVKNHPYCDIMKCFLTCPQENQPRILGLTASLVNANVRLEDLETEVKNLEATLQSIVTTATDIPSLKKYGTDPKEHVVFYEEFNFAAHPILKKIIDFLSDAHSIFSKSEINMPPNVTSIDIYFTSPKKCLTSLRTILNTLGPLGTLYASEIFEKEVTKSLNASVNKDDKSTYLSLQKCLKLVSKKLRSLFENESLLEDTLLLPKLKRLLNILHFYKDGYPTGENSSEQLCCIIFVEQRIIAFVLHMVLKEVSGKWKDFAFVKCQYVIGHSVNSTLLSKMAKMHTSQQTRILEDFRKEKFNILIATSVIEEGMDVHTCNLVIRFDPPRDFRSYVQSRGRARAKKATYILLIDNANKDYLKTHLSFKNIEKHLEKYCFNRIAPREDEITDALSNDIIPCFMPDPRDGKPRLTCTSAISLINRYCSLLSSSAVTLQPDWTMASVFIAKHTCYICTLMLPINSPLKEPIEGSAMKNKKNAKMSAAFEACLRLYKMGELDENFLPVSQRVTSQDLTDLGLPPVETTDPLIGTRKHRRHYPKKVSAPLQMPEEATRWRHCYAIRMKVITHRTPQNPRYSLQLEEEGLAFLTSVSVPKVPRVALYSYYTTMELHLEELPDFNLDFTEQQSRLLLGFHHRIFQDLKFDRKFLPLNIEGCPIIAPLKAAGHINWELIQQVVQHNLHLPLYTKSSPYLFDRSKFANAVVQYPYCENKRLYFVKEFLDDLTPASPHPNGNHENFAHFFESLYGIEITNLEQPVIIPRYLHPVDLLKPLPKYKVPQFKTPLINMVNIGYRVGIASHWGQTDVLPDTTLSLDASVNFYNEGLYIYPYTIPSHEDGSRRVYFDRHSILQPSSLPTSIPFLHALTLISASDNFNLERLETIGDSFLKYVVTVLIYRKFNTDEGKLHLLRSRLICNKNLFNLACARDLPQLIRSIKFDPYNNWKPPGFQINPDVLEDEQLLINTQEISDKSIADAVEALIGSYLLTCGPMGALRFLSWLGLEFLQQETCLDSQQVFTEPFTWITIPPPQLDSNIDYSLPLEMLYSTLNIFEQDLGYTFHNKLYLIQAMTHASFYLNRLTPCYQRLEFLGDAVLDFIVTSYIYKDSRLYTPGQLTDLRSSLVGNSFFSFMAVKYGFDKCLKLHNYNLYKIIKVYKDIRGPNPEHSEEKQLEKYLYQEYDEMTLETPKVLGDLFESVAGAIFLDSGMSLDTVWRVYYPHDGKCP